MLSATIVPEGLVAPAFESVGPPPGFSVAGPILATNGFDELEDARNPCANTTVCGS